MAGRKGLSSRLGVRGTAWVGIGAEDGGRGNTRLAVRPVTAVEVRVEKWGMSGLAMGVDCRSSRCICCSRVAREDRQEPEPTGLRERWKDDEGRWDRGRGEWKVVISAGDESARGGRLRPGTGGRWSSSDW